MENMIEITGIDLIAFVKKVYELSTPQGLGFMHFTLAPLSENDAKEIVENGKADKRCPISMDYVKGRACKMTVFAENGKLFILKSWYDHTDRQLQELLSAFNIKITGDSEHGCACNCADCQKKRRSEKLTA